MRIALSSGAYQAKSIIASAQRCVNLYAENNPADSVFPTTHYLTPGTLRLRSFFDSGQNINGIRCVYRASNGDLYVVCGKNVYYVNPAFSGTLLGTITSGISTPVAMRDNGLVVLIADGTSSLWAIEMTSKSFAPVTGGNFYGADSIGYIDTFFVLNRPSANQWYISISQPTFEILTGGVGAIVAGTISNSGNTGAIATGMITDAGASYTDGAYTNIPFISGSGSGATANLTVSGGHVTLVGISARGINYQVGDILGISTNSLSTRATGTYTFTVNPVAGNTIILNGVTWTFVASGASSNQTNIGVDLAATLTQLASDLQSSATSSIEVATYTVSPTVLTITYDAAGVVGNSYALAAGTYGGVVSGATLSGGVSATGSGFTYTVSTTQGSYTNGNYVGVPLTGGSGSGAVATITVANNLISDIVIINAGTNYQVGDLLSAASSSVGGVGSGFVYLVGTIGGGGFDALDIATKNGYPDNIQGIVVMHREIWIIGTLTSEVWYNAGAADFTFQNLPGTFIEHGAVAKYSIAKQDLSVYWLSQDEQGQAIVIRGTEYQARRISTFAIENEFSTYSRIDDAIGWTYQQEGHTFYVLTFPTANATWVYDQAMDLWHQRTWTDNQGVLNRHRMNCGCNVYGKNVIGDWENGNLYELSLTTYTDSVDGLGSNSDGTYPISRIRSFPTLMNESKRVVYQGFTADMEVGNDVNAAVPATVSLRWSDDRGKTYGNAVQQNFGELGQYLAIANWNRLGMGRGRVFELSWSLAAKTALNGAWVTATPAAS